MQRALILLDGDQIDTQALCFEAGHAMEMASAPLPGACQSLPAVSGGRLPEDLRSVEEKMILDALEHSRGSRKGVAEQLGISERTLRYKIARMRDAGVSIPSLMIIGMNSASSSKSRQYPRVKP